MVQELWLLSFTTILRDPFLLTTVQVEFPSCTLNNLANLGFGIGNIRSYWDGRPEFQPCLWDSLRSHFPFWGLSFPICEIRGLERVLTYICRVSALEFSRLLLIPWVLGCHPLRKFILNSQMQASSPTSFYWRCLWPIAVLHFPHSCFSFPTFLPSYKCHWEKLVCSTTFRLYLFMKMASLVSQLVKSLSAMR